MCRRERETGATTQREETVIAIVTVAEKRSERRENATERRRKV